MSVKQNYVNVRVSRDVHAELSKLGDLSTNYSEVISSLIKSATKQRGESK